MSTTGGPWVRMLGAVAAGMAALLVLLVISAAGDDDASSPELSGVDITKIPKLAAQMLPVIDDVLDRQCPELPAVWVVAEVQAESGWNPKAHSADSNGGASGLYQMNDRNWAVAGGRADEITIPETHLRVGIPWVCTNLRAVTGHLEATHKPTAPLDAMLVCHIAGCGRVTGSATGVPKVGEAGCGSACVSLINRYIANVHRYVARFATPPRAPASPPDVLAEGPAAVQPVAVAAPAAAAVAAPAAVGTGFGAGRTVTFGGITSSLPLSPAPFTGPVAGGWGQRYDGGGVYNTRSATGGHYDHVHVSYQD